MIITNLTVNENELKHLIDLGVHSVLRKPVDIDVLLDKIEEVGSS